MRLIQDKIKSVKALRDIIRRLKRQHKRIGFTNGCFDILHSGHADYLQRAKNLTDILIVAVNSDSSVRRIKGKTRPIIKLQNRMKLVAALESVDFVTHFSEDTPYEIIASLKPDMLIKGGDWPKSKIVGRDIVESHGGKVITVPFKKGNSSTKIIEKVTNNLKKN